VTPTNGWPWSIGVEWGARGGGARAHAWRSNARSDHKECKLNTPESTCTVSRTGVRAKPSLSRVTESLSRAALRHTAPSMPRVKPLACWRGGALKKVATNYAVTDALLVGPEHEKGIPLVRVLLKVEPKLHSVRVHRGRHRLVGVEQDRLVRAALEAASVRLQETHVILERQQVRPCTSVETDHVTTTSPPRHHHVTTTSSLQAPPARHSTSQTVRHPLHRTCQLAAAATCGEERV
jgi:hypothetical protein